MGGGFRFYWLAQIQFKQILFNVTKNSSIYVLILAGGSGERFWPLSRRNRPKQLLSLFSTTTLLEDTMARLEGLVPRDHILILTNQEQEAAVRALAPALPPENIVAEPAKRDTAAAIALGAGWISLAGPGGHHDRAAGGPPHPGPARLPDHPAHGGGGGPGDGEPGDHRHQANLGLPRVRVHRGGGAGGDRRAPAQPVREVARFREKPNPQLAEQFLKQGNFRWNAGMFIWPLPAILCELARHAAPLAEFVERLHASGDFAGTLANRFCGPAESLDRLRRHGKGRAGAGGGGRVRLGRYRELAGRRQVPAAGRRRELGEHRRLTTQDARGNIVYTTRPGQVALMGVRDLIVVQTEDALLVAHRESAEKIKNLVALVPGALQ